MIKIGDYNEMLAYEKVEHGMYLIHPDDAESEDVSEKKVLLPNAYLSSGLKINDKLEVFIYLDSEDRIIATNLKPSITVGKFAFLPVKEVNTIGAFLDMGLAKDLLVPYRQQAVPMLEGKSYLVYMYLDETTKRLIASSKINQFLSNEVVKLLEGEEVDLLVVNKTSLGYNVIVNQQHKGLVFHSDVFTSIQTGDAIKGYVKSIREDNKLDILLQQQGLSSIEPNAQKIIDYLKNNGGESELSDKSSPEEISDALGMSKKSFKKALGALYKKRLVELTNDSTRLV